MFTSLRRSLMQQVRRWGSRQLPLSRRVWVSGRATLLSSVCVTACLWGIQQFGWLESLETAVFDKFVQLQPDASPDTRLFIVAIAESDLQRYGWPISDRILAQSLERLQSYHPAVIGLDLYRDLPKPPGEKALAAQLQASNLIAITEIVGGIPAPPGVERDRVAFNDFTLDVNGVLRRNLLFVSAPEQNYYSLALRVCLAYLQPAGAAFRFTPQALWLGKVPLFPLEPTSGGYQTADTRGYQILLKYRARRQVAPSATLAELLDGAVPPERVRGKIVLIGTVAPSLKDMVYTPYSSELDTSQMSGQMSGVILHAQMIGQLLDIAAGKPMQFGFWSRWLEVLWLWLWAVVGSLLVWWLKHPLSFGLAGLLCLATIAGSSWGLFGQLVWIPAIEPALGAIASMGMAMALRLVYISNHDPVTGLLNRGSFVRYLRRSLAQMPRRNMRLTLGVMFFDLERLRAINKTLGYQTGDGLLLQAIGRLRAILPPSARLARIGSEEFAVSLEHGREAPLTALADRLHDALAEPFLLDEQAFVTAVSIGIAIAQEGYRHTPENLLRDAHTAMYRAKATGQGRYEVFAAGMLQEDVDRFVLENDLRQGISAREFVLYYQPIVALPTGNIAGFEALVRWQHPHKGFVMPQTFIPLAEETGLIVALGKWICREACEQAYHWQSQFPGLPLLLSINLSGRQFEQVDLAEQLVQSVREAGIETSMLKLEITESMAIGDMEGSIDRMLALKSLGFKLGMDDFGTGYSSLSHLRRFPVDTLKVDKSFVQQMTRGREDFEIVRAIVSLSHALGMDVVAEGVETQADAEALRSLGCEFGQGYFWAKPLPAAEATVLLRQATAQNT